MRYLSVAQMREADRRAIEGLGIPSVVLMNNAGQAVFDEIARGPVGILCGKGNNGGDGFVVARLALAAGLETHVVLVAGPAKITEDAAAFMRAYVNLGGTVEAVRDEAAVREAVGRFARCAVVVDALLGTGVRGEVRGAALAAIEALPEVPVIAVDLPSGLNADTGEVCGCCVKAETTVTFQFPKQGFEHPGVSDYIGRLVVADIGIPEVCADDAAWGKLGLE